jgi:hypothetical protein
VQLAQEEQGANAEAKLKQRHDGDAEEEQQDEKARLMGSLSSADVDLEKGVDHEQGSREDLPRPDGSTRRDGSGSPRHVPSTAEAAIPDATPTTSVKARGKMKARRSASLDTTGSLDRITAARVGRNGFVPTDDWVCLVLRSLF